MSTYGELGLTMPVSELFDVRAWRERYAWGIPLAGAEAFTPQQQLIEACHKLNEGDQRAQVQQLVAQIPDHVILWQLKVAASELQDRLDIPLGIVRVKSHPVDEGLVHGRDYDRLDPRLPYVYQEAQHFYLLSLPYSVISVQRIRGYYFNQKIIEVSPDQGNIGQITLQWPRQGITNILPVNMSALIVGQGFVPADYALSLWEMVWSKPNVPDFWAVDYIQGPMDTVTRTPGRIDLILAHWVFLRAGKLLLNMAGTAYGQGIVSESVTMDGFTRSLTTSQSAMYSINSAMEIVFQSYVDSIDWERLRRRQRGLKVFSVNR